MSDDKEEKLPTSEELPTSADGDEERKEEPRRRPSNAALAGMRIPIFNEAGTEEPAIRPSNAALVGTRIPIFNEAGTEEPRPSRASADLTLYFSKSELERFAEHRKTGLRPKSIDWINRAAQALWDCTRGDISYETMTALRAFALEKYNSVDSHSKVLSFAKSFLKFLATILGEPRYVTFAPYLELPKTVKERKSVTSRIVTREDINNVLQHIKKAERGAQISPEQYAQYSAFTLFGAYTGQRSEATIAKLTVGQFREALAADKLVLLVDSSQDKIRMSHYVPLHPRVVEALKPLLVGRNDNELMFNHSSFLQWVKRQKIQMSRFKGHFVLGDLRKFAEQYGDIIQWEQSNRSYILTHAVSGVDWAHYRNPLPEPVYDVYMQCWHDVKLG